MSQDWIHGPRCGIDNCRSRKYAIGEDGFKYCSRGHQAAEQLIGDDDEYMGAAAKKSKRSGDEDAVRPPKYLQGREATSLFLQCYQLLLRKQTWWLIREKNFPPELETIVKDLWALKLQMLKPLLQERDESSRSFSSQSSSRAASRASSRSSQPSSASEMSDHEFEAESDGSMHFSQSRANRRARRPRFIDSLGILYLAALLLHLPLSVGDVYAWIMAPGYPFLRGLDYLPTTMKQTLPPNMLKTFDSRIGAPDPGKIHLATIEVASSYASMFDMQMPTINHSLLLVRYMKNLGLPLDVFTFTQHLSRLLNVSHAMPDASHTHLASYSHPEAQLVGLLCIAVKLLYPFDGLTRAPRTPNEPGTLGMPWQKWNDIHTAKSSFLPHASTSKVTPDQSGATEENMLSITEKDILSMTGPELDTYMAWFRRTWLPRDDTEGDAESQNISDYLRAVWALFPVDGSGDATSATASASTNKDKLPRSFDGDAEDPLTFVHAVQASLDHVDAVSDTDAAREDNDRVLRMGSSYTHYRTVSDIPEIGLPFFKAAAQAVGLSLEQMVQVVFSLEMKVLKWTQAQRSEVGRGRSRERRQHGRDNQGDTARPSADGDGDAMSLDLGDDDF